jgi:hypothetical protein
MRLRDGRTRYELVLTRAAAGVSESQVYVDGELYEDAVGGGGVHLVEITLAGDLTPRYAPASASP